jgi:hypothetical protein
MTSESPVTKFYDRLWMVLESSPEFVKTFLEPNRKKYLTREAADLQVRQAADYPAIGIFPSNTNNILPRIISSDCQTFDQAVTVEIKTGETELSTLDSLIWMISTLVLENKDYLMSEEVLCLTLNQRPGISRALNSLGWNTAISMDIKFSIPRV